MLESIVNFYTRSTFLFYDRVHTRHHPRDFIIHNVLARMERGAGEVT